MSIRPSIEDRRLLAIIPARQGSQGVVRKNMRELSGRPLLALTVETIEESGVADRIAVSTDDPVVADWAAMRGIEVIARPVELAQPDSTISEVALHAIQATSWKGAIGIYQPTSPLRSALSVKLSFERFLSSGADSLSSAVRESHLLWQADGSSEFGHRPLYTERVNRQFGDHGILKETGSIQLVWAAALERTGSVVTDRHVLFETSPEESDDIDTPEDLALVRLRSIKAPVIFRLTANRLVGSGHLHHCLQLAEYLDFHEVVFLLKECDAFAVDLLTALGWRFEVEGNDLEHDLARIALGRSGLLVNDILDTSIADVLIPRQLGLRVVNIEDLGAGARYADLVVNALYASDDLGGPGHLTGPKFATLRSEFLGLPKREVRQEARRLMVSFGGTDPSSLTSRILSLLENQIEGVDILAVLGSGAESVKGSTRATIRRDIRNMAREMMNSDLLITAGGRTIYEAAATGTPTVVLAQSAREATHAHLGLDNGVVFLGIGQLVPDSVIVETVQRLLADYDLRLELSQRIAKSVDLRGAERIAVTIDMLLRGVM